MRHLDTIFALSSGRPPSAVAVIRISGPRARIALETMIGRVPEPRRAAFARVRDPRTGDVIDEALAMWFPGPRSELGEDMAELQVHGGPAVIAAVSTALGRLDGFRPAEAGEFTRRAFENGKLDLTAVEGLADLIYAETEAQRRQAYRQLKGLLGEQAESWRRRLLEALALVEAQIDFVDEADVPEDLVGPALEAARQLQADIGRALRDASRGERLRDGLVVAIAGPPNAGKSTLLNRLARREAAIVSPHAGTTRDVIEVHLDLDGYPMTLLDTAGIRETTDPVEIEGVRRARERASQADLVLWIEDGTEPGKSEGEASGGSLPGAGMPMVWTVRNKIDLIDSAQKRSGTSGVGSRSTGAVQEFTLSAATGEGIDALVDELGAFARDYFASGEPPLLTRQRHRRMLEDTVAALQRAVEEGVSGREEIVADELRIAARALGRLTGRVDVEDILDVIFRDFCIGK